MKHLALLTLILLATGCASTSSVEELSTRVAKLESDHAALSADLVSVKADVKSAVDHSIKAHEAATKAEKMCLETLSRVKELEVKFDRMFKKSMQK